MYYYAIFNMMHMHYLTRDLSKHGSKTYSETAPTFQTILFLLTVVKPQVESSGAQCVNGYL